MISKDFGGIRELFYVLSSDKTTKHGLYVRFRPLPGDRALVFELGSYQNGNKHGRWEKFLEGFPQPTWDTTDEIIHYFDGKKHGVWNSFFSDTASSIVNVVSVPDLLRSGTVFYEAGIRNKRLRQAGMFINDRKVGEWSTFDYSGKLLHKFDFNKSVVLFDKTIPDSSSYNSNRKPLFIGGDSMLLTLLRNALAEHNIVPRLHRNSVTAVIEFTVSKDARVDGMSVTSNLAARYLEKELERLVSLTDLKWHPALQNGVPVDSRVRVRFDVEFRERTYMSKS